MKPQSATPGAVMRLDGSASHLLARDAGDVVDIGSTRVQILVRGCDALGGSSLVEYAVPPRMLVAPAHRHTCTGCYGHRTIQAACLNEQAPLHAVRACSGMITPVYMRRPSSQQRWLGYRDRLAPGARLVG